MRKRVILVSLLVICLAVVPSVALTSSTGIPEGNAETAMHVLLSGVRAPDELEFELAATDPPTERRMTVYKVLNPVIDAQYVEAIGGRLGFLGDAGPSGSSSIGMIDDCDGIRRALRVFTASGGIEYMLVDQWFPVVKSQPVLPSKEDAQEMAIDFLTKYDLLPQDAVCTGVVESGTQEKATEGKVVEKYVVQLAVTFSRSLDGVPVTGSGQQLVVYVGEDDVTGVIKLWRDIEPCKQVQLRSASEAFSSLQAGGEGCGYVVSEEVTKVVIDSISIAYWMNGADYYQEYLSPVYEFRGNCLDASGTPIGSFLGWCEALDFAA